MALIEVFHVVASQFPVDANNATDIPQGRIVTLTAAGEVQLALSNVPGTSASYPVGIAGDSRSDGTTSFTPESGSPLNTQEGLTKSTALSGSLILGAYGDQQRFTQNRVADNFNEVLASGKMTVYHGGGEFWSDQYDVSGTYTPGTGVFSAVHTGADLGLISDVIVAGVLADANMTHVVGISLTSPTGYPSGVPGTGPSATGFTALPEGGNSLAWGNFLHFKMTL